MLVRRNSLVPGGRNPFDLNLDRVFRDVFEALPLDTGDWGAERRDPAVNAWEDEAAFHVEAELPGFDEKDLNLTVLGNELRLEGSRTETTEEGTKVLHRERRTGEFSRVLRFPVELDGNGVEASFRNGLLTVKLPKAKTALPRKIEVQG